MLDLEGFRCSKNNFIVKELTITIFEYSDSPIFLNPASFNSLPKSEQAYNSLTNSLHGIHWEIHKDFKYLTA